MIGDFYLNFEFPHTITLLDQILLIDLIIDNSHNYKKAIICYSYSYLKSGNNIIIICNYKVYISINS